jgi:hypothetical protein
MRLVEAHQGGLRGFLRKNSEIGEKRHKTYKYSLMCMQKPTDEICGLSVAEDQK